MGKKEHGKSMSWKPVTFEEDHWDQRNINTKRTQSQGKKKLAHVKKIEIGKKLAVPS